MRADADVRDASVADDARAPGAVPAVVVVELDGVLLDTTYLHVHAWRGAFVEAGEHVASVAIHRQLGAGPERLLRALVGREDERLVARHDELFAAEAHLVGLHPGAAELMASLRAARAQVVAVAPDLTTATRSCLPRQLGLDDGDVLDASSVAPGEGPELLDAALARHDVRDEAVVVAASTALLATASCRGFSCVGVETGGAHRRDLLAAGATVVSRDLVELQHRWHGAGVLDVVESLRGGTVDVVIEIPAGTRNKYEHDPTTGTLRLDRALPSSLAYPADYGYVPGTLAEDGDPLDVLVLLDEPVVPGTTVRVALLGVLWVEDEEGRDPKLLAVLPQRAEREALLDLDDLAPWRLEELEHFFKVYKQLETGRSSRSCGFGDRAAAWAELTTSRARGAASSRAARRRWWRSATTAGRPDVG